MSIIEALTEEFKKFPGIGPRQAKRFVYFLLSRDRRTRETLAKYIQELNNDITICSSCFRYFTTQNRSATLCTICTGNNRDSSKLMLVEKDVDLENIERSGAYEGQYFVLGGSIPVLEKEPDKRIRGTQLTQRLKEGVKSKSLQEVILAFSHTPDGDNTARHVRELIMPFAEMGSLKITILGRGLSTGSELEYSDSETIKSALQNRQ